MGWEVGFDPNWRRDVGYGVPAVCDDPGCSKKIHRGLAYVCGGDVYGGEDGCGLHFCADHLFFNGAKWQRCARCMDGEDPFKPKPDVREWLEHKLTDPTWEEWRQSEPEEVARIREALGVEAPTSPGPDRRGEDEPSGADAGV